MRDITFLKHTFIEDIEPVMGRRIMERGGRGRGILSDKGFIFKGE
jgi:hypothetical protein